MTKRFIEQIREDLQSIKNTWIANDAKLENDWYGFNYWSIIPLFHITLFIH